MLTPIFRLKLHNWSRIQVSELILRCTNAEIFQYNPDYQLPVLETETEYQHISETAHFKASAEATGYTHLYLDGDYIERIRYWNE